MKKNLSHYLCAYAADVLNRHWTALLTEMEGVHDLTDIEHVHRMRVATRRLRAALPIFSLCFPTKKVAQWTSDIRQITRALGAARDSDVQIELLTQILSSLPETHLRPGVRRLLLRRQQTRTALQPKVVQAVEKFHESPTLTSFPAALAPHLPPPEVESPVLTFDHALYALAAEHIQARLEEFLSFEAHVAYPDHAEELHAMRIAAKGLRYTLEAFAPLYADQLKDELKTLRAFQDTLGALHDADVWLAELPRFAEKELRRTEKFYGSARPFRSLRPGLDYFAQNRASERERVYQELVRLWEQTQTRGLWSSLLDQVQLPLLRAEGLYPAVQPTPSDEA